jgi:hypothetical protein
MILGVIAFGIWAYGVQMIHDVTTSVNPSNMLHPTPLPFFKMYKHVVYSRVRSMPYERIHKAAFYNIYRIDRDDYMDNPGMPKADSMANIFITAYRLNLPSSGCQPRQSPDLSPMVELNKGLVPSAGGLREKSWAWSGALPLVYPPPDQTSALRENLSTWTCEWLVASNKTFFTDDDRTKFALSLVHRFVAIHVQAVYILCNKGPV